MIQPINESEKNRIRNLHRKHFILNENKGEYPDIPGFEKDDDDYLLVYKKIVSPGNALYLKYYKDKQLVNIRNTKGYPLDKEIGDELSKHGKVKVRSAEKGKHGSMLLVKRVNDINKLITDITPILTKLYK